MSLAIVLGSSFMLLSLTSGWHGGMMGNHNDDDFAANVDPDNQYENCYEYSSEQSTWEDCSDNYESFDLDNDCFYDDDPYHDNSLDHREWHETMEYFHGNGCH